jgi:adenylate cyclase
MPELPISSAARLAWQLAGDFALRRGQNAIEPKHLLYGICAVEKVVKAGRAQPQTPAAAERLQWETAQLSDLALRNSVDLAVVRRAMRKASANAQGTATAGGVASRSAEVRNIFERGTDIAESSDLEEMDLLSLLQALLESPDQQISALMATSAPGLADMLREMRSTSPSGMGVLTSGVSQLTALDSDPQAAGQPVQVSQTLDASKAVTAAAGSAVEALAWLSELTWECGTRYELEALLQRATEELLRILPMTDHCLILMRDKCDGELLLMAFSPQTWAPRVSMTSVRRAVQEKKGFLWVRGDDLTRSQKEANLETGIYVPLVVNGEALGVICLDSTMSEQHFGCGELKLVTCFAHQVALAIANHELRTSLKQNADVLERLLTNFSPKVRTRLLQRAQMGRLALGGELSVVSILCSDIRGFTRLTANMAGDDIVAMLNEYFAALVDCIFRHDGTVDKFVGDSILAVFGSPEADPRHHQKAVSAACEMQQVMQRVSEQRKARGEVACELGIGVHAGEVLHGFIGSPERMEFTVIGEAVNLAARYSDGAKASEVLISPQVYQRVWNLFQAEKVSIQTKHEGELAAYRITSQSKIAAPNAAISGNNS